MFIGYIILKVGRMKNNYQLIYNREINRIIKKYGCFFVVITNTKFIYVYGVKVSEIKKKLNNKDN